MSLMNRERKVSERYVERGWVSSWESASLTLRPKAKCRSRHIDL